MIGYEEESGSRVYRVLDEVSRQVFIARDLVLDEESAKKSLGSLYNGTENREGV